MALKEVRNRTRIGIIFNLKITLSLKFDFNGKEIMFIYYGLRHLIPDDKELPRNRCYSNRE